MTFTATQRNDVLKLIALFTMFIDHLGMLFFPELTWMRTIGRIAFPIFAYQIALGFIYTRSRYKYALRLLLFAIIAQVPYSFFNVELHFYPFGLNIIWTLFYAVIVLFVIHKGESYFLNAKKEQQLPLFMRSGLLFCLAILLIILPEILAFTTPFHMEYGSTGVCFVILFYCLHNRPLSLFLGYVLLSLASTYYGLAKSSYYLAPQLYTPLSAMLDYKNAFRIAAEYDTQWLTLSGRLFQARSIMALPIIYVLEKLQSQGLTKFRLNRYVAYWFYPAHIALLLVFLHVKSLVWLYLLR